MCDYYRNDDYRLAKCVGLFCTFRVYSLRYTFHFYCLSGKSDQYSDCKQSHSFQAYFPICLVFYVGIVTHIYISCGSF